MRKFLFVVVVGLGACSAMATPEFLAEFKKHYAVRAGSELDKARCMVCHTTPPARNPFGKDVAKVIDANFELTAAALQGIEAKDSDGDGVSNGYEIKADTRPGDPNSKPQTAEKPQASGGELIPSHSFHPAFVHFPIALFIFGVALEFLALARKEPTIRSAARWCLIGGSWALAVAIPSGLIATFRLGYGIAPTSPAFVHLLMGLGSAVLMIATCAYGKQNDNPTYRVLLVVTAALVGATGHFGGNLVFGG
jgi:uncharacterized membrane protein